MISIPEAIESAVTEVVRLTERFHSAGRGREALGAVPGRPESEDVEIGLDRACQEVIEGWLGRTGAPIEVHSEHGVSRVGPIDMEAEFLIAVDPFDGSGLYARGIPAEWWSVVSAFRPGSLEPVAGAAADVLRREIYTAGCGGVTVRPLEGERPAKVGPNPRRRLDNDVVLALYLMSPVYRSHWTDRGALFMDMLARRFPGCLLWPNGGSCIYPWIARGIVDAYISFDEPVSEIDPGLAFAHFAGYPVFEVRSDGTLEPHGFVPGRMAERTRLLVSACTEDLARELAAEITGQ